MPASKYENLQVFYLGCSFGFEHALQQAKVPLRNVDQNKNVSMYKTNIQMNPGKSLYLYLHSVIIKVIQVINRYDLISFRNFLKVGVFGGPMVVSMRYIPLDQAWINIHHEIRSELNYFIYGLSTCP